MGDVLFFQWSDACFIIPFSYMDHYLLGGRKSDVFYTSWSAELFVCDVCVHLLR